MIYDWLYILLGIIVLPGIIFAAVAQNKVTKAYNKNLSISSVKGVKAVDMTRKVLDAAGLNDVKIDIVPGKLTDHYDPRTKTVALSQENANSTSLAALGIAAHEVGHALQYATNYKPIKIRNIFRPIEFIVSKFFFLFLIFTILLDVVVGMNLLPFPIFTCILIGLYVLTTIVSMVTLPIEYNASARTELILVESGLLDETEYDNVKEVLNAAALTYVAAAVYSLLQLVRVVVYVLIHLGKFNNNK